MGERLVAAATSKAIVLALGGLRDRPGDDARALVLTIHVSPAKWVLHRSFDRSAMQVTKAKKLGCFTCAFRGSPAEL